MIYFVVEDIGEHTTGHLLSNEASFIITDFNFRNVNSISLLQDGIAKMLLFGDCKRNIIFAMVNGFHTNARKI